MANISADLVKQLRERTGAGMMECKKALVETSGDLEAAAELMRKQGLAKADKKATRVAAEGVVVVEKAADGRSAAMVEINCETDFVAREADFQGFATDVARKALETRATDVAALAARIPDGARVAIAADSMGVPMALIRALARRRTRGLRTGSTV